MHALKTAGAPKQQTHCDIACCIAQKGAQTGGIIEKEGPIHVSNVMLLDPQDNQPTRVGVREGEGGKRARFARRTNNPVD